MGDIDRGGFEDVLDEVVSTVMSVFRRADPTKASSIAIQPTPLDDNSRDRYRTNRKRAAVLAQVGRYEFQTQRFDIIQEKPIIYWWKRDFLDAYKDTPKIEEVSPGRAAQSTGDNIRFTRIPWEIENRKFFGQTRNTFAAISPYNTWHPFVNGAAGTAWIEPLRSLL